MWNQQRLDQLVGAFYRGHPISITESETEDLRSTDDGFHCVAVDSISTREELFTELNESVYEDYLELADSHAPPELPDGASMDRDLIEYLLRRRIDRHFEDADTSRAFSAYELVASDGNKVCLVLESGGYSFNTYHEHISWYRSRQEFLEKQIKPSLCIDEWMSCTEEIAGFIADAVIQGVAFDGEDLRSLCRETNGQKLNRSGG